MKCLISILVTTILFCSDFTNNGAVLTIQNGVTISMNGSFENNGSVNHSGYFTISGDLLNPGTFSADASSTVLLNGSDQSFPALELGNLTIEGDGTKTMLGSVYVSSSFILNSGTLNLNGNTLTIFGDTQNNGGAVIGIGSILLNGVELYGCMDEQAENYDPVFIFDSGECSYEFPGCTDQTAYNFVDTATWDDGSCIYYGDVNMDNVINVVDVIYLVGMVLQTVEPTIEESELADVVPDGVVNIMDIVQVIDWILNGDVLADMSPLQDAQITLKVHSLSINSTGDVAGIQLETVGDYTISQMTIPDGWILEKGNTGIIALSLDGSRLNGNSLFTFDGNIEIVSALTVDWFGNAVQASVKVIPEEFELNQAYPNPFNPITTISYGLPEDTFVQIRIYDLNGRQVSELVNNTQSAGTYQVNWNASNQSSGVYLVKMVSGDYTKSQKLLLVK